MIEKVTEKKLTIYRQNKSTAHRFGQNKSMKVYIQKEEGKQLEDDWLFASNLGAQKLGMDIIYFPEDEIDSIPKNQFVIAFVENTIKYFDRTGIKYPSPLNIPEELMSYAKREIRYSTLDFFIANAHNPAHFNFPIFIKPAHKLKGCPSGVLKKPTDVALLFTDVENKKQSIQYSEVISMESEYRAFVNKGELVGLKHYSGSFELFPDISIIKKMILEYKSAPISYTLDVAITDKNETILVECNDAWAIGSYGLDEKIYIRLLIDRWKELINVSNTE
jgi:hypothetical protein